MGEQWRVTVERVDSVNEQGYEKWSQVVGLAASREQLARFAPSVVAEALGATEGALAQDAARFTQNSSSELTKPENPIAGSPAALGQAEPAKRTRRTKAQIEADKAAEALKNGSAATVPGPVVDPALVPPAPPGAQEVGPSRTDPYNPFIR